MKAYKCDQCGKIILEKDVSYSLVVWRQGEMSGGVTEDVDLCPACMERVENVLGQIGIKIKFVGEN